MTGERVVERAEHGDSAVSDSDVPWQRLDGRVIWVDAARALLSLTPIGLATLVFQVDFELSSLWPALGIAVIGVVGGVGDALRWLKTRYRITDEHVERRTGLIVRSHRSIRRDRIRNVDTAAKLRHRLAGIRVVTIGAGQQKVAGEAALTLDAVSVATAEWLRRELLHARPGEPRVEAPGAEESAVAPAAGTVLARIDWRWVFYNIFNVWAYIMALGLLWGAYWLATTFGLDPAGFVGGLVDWEALGLGWSIALAAGVVGLIGVIGLAANFFTENWGFTLSRVPGERGTVLRTSQGLFKTREVNRDDNRLRGVQVGEPLLWRWMGMADTTIITTGFALLSMAPGSTILPRGPIGVARRVTAAVLDEESSPVDAILRPHPGAALRRRLAWAVVITGLVTVALAWLDATVDAIPDRVWLIGPAVLLVALVLAVVAYRSLGHGIVGEYLVMRSGAMNRTTSVLQRRAVAGWVFRQSVLQRRLGLMTVSATTAAGVGIYRIPDAAADQAVAFAHEAVPDLLTPFLSSPSK